MGADLCSTLGDDERGRLRPAHGLSRPKALLGVGAGGGRPLPKWESGGITPGKLI